MKCSSKGSLSKSSFLVNHSASAESAIPTKGHWSYLSDMWAKGRDVPVARSRCAIPDPPKVSVVDEFSIEKGHKYAKLVIDSKKRRCSTCTGESPKRISGRYSRSMTPAGTRG